LNGLIETAAAVVAASLRQETTLEESESIKNLNQALANAGTISQEKLSQDGHIQEEEEEVAQ